MYRMGVIAAAVFLLVGQAGAGELPSMFGDRGKALDTWPVLGTRLEQVEDAPAAGPATQESSGKSTGKAVLLSALVPGAGEFYLGAWKRGALFFGVEALAWGLYFSWNGKGHDIEDEFRATADQEWDPHAYLAWLDSGNSRFSSTHHDLPCKDFIEIYKETGGFGDCADSEVQQYYEVIGKYNQFVSGWSDLRDLIGNTVQPSQVDSVEFEETGKPRFLSEFRDAYEERRHDSNKFLKRAGNLTGLIMINHVFSLIDASRLARARAQGVEEARLERRTRFMFAMRSGSRGQVPMLLAYKPF